MIEMRMKALFFDAPRVQRAMDAATRRALSQAGAFIRQRAKTSIRERKGISKAGHAPHSHAGHLRRLIFIAWDAITESMVIGPVPLKEGEAPSLLEFGGTAVRRIPARRDRGSGRGPRRRMTCRKRPLMAPALKAELPQLLQRFRDSV